MEFLSRQLNRRRMRGTVRAVLCLLVMVLTAFEPVSLTAAPGKTITEDQLPSLYSALILKIAMFVEWPDEAPDSENGKITLGISGSDKVFKTFQQLSDKKIQGRDLILIHCRTAEDLQPRRILYFCADHPGDDSSGESANNLFNSLDDKFRTGVLTIGKAPDFNATGGMIQLDIVNGRPRFTVNLEAAEAAGIKFSSKLLKVAIIYQGETP